MDGVEVWEINELSVVIRVGSESIDTFGREFVDVEGWARRD